MIRQLIEKGNPEKMCFFITDNRLFMPKEEGIERYFTAFLTEEIMFKNLQAFVRNDIFTDSNFEVYQCVRTWITRKELGKEKREHFRKFQSMLLEMGHQTHFRQHTPNLLGVELASRGDKEAPRIYWTLQEYIIDNTRVQGLTFNQLDPLARLYFGLAVTILLANLAHCFILRLLLRVAQTVYWMLNCMLQKTVRSIEDDF